MNDDLAPESNDAAPAAPVAEAPAAPSVDTSAAPAAAPAAPAKPATMLEAVFPKEQPKPEAEAAVDLRPRDHLGRFVPKTAAERDAAVKAGVPVAPIEAAKPADPNAPPEGLSPKAQERFQALANERRELSEKLDERTRQIDYVQKTFQEHGVQQPQFEQAVQVIGMLNRGDYEGAQRVLLAQLEQISVLSGRPVAGIDALAHFPDLREAVNGQMMTEPHAFEVARARVQQHATQQTRQRAEQERQSAERAEQEFLGGQRAVDAFCKRMQASDLDYAAVEAQLLPHVPALLKDIPPSRWAASVEAQYRLLKDAAAKFRQAAPSGASSSTLRPTGQGSPAVAPRSMAEAMWGKPLAA